MYIFKIKRIFCIFQNFISSKLKKIHEDSFVALMSYVAQLEAKIGTGWGISMIDRALESCFTQYIFMISPTAQLWSNISTNYPGGGGILNPCYSCTNLNIDVNFLWHTWPQLLIALCYFCDGIFIMSWFIMKKKHGHCVFLVFSWCLCKKIPHLNCL